MDGPAERLATGAMRPTTAQELPRIDGYSMEAVIGSGGMGTVYRARQLSLGRPVAVKVLADPLCSQPGYVSRFEQEGCLQARVQHPHVLPVLDRGEADGKQYIVMRLVHGPNMRQLVRFGAVGPAQTVELLTGVGAALDHAHASGILHLDVKPHNVLIEGEWHAWLADFGLTCLVDEAARGTGTRLRAGTYDYLAPELVHGEAPSTASDVYSLAVTAFQCLTGELPFPLVNDRLDLFANACLPRPAASERRPGLPGAVDTELQRAMSVDPTERPLTAGELIDSLRIALGLPPRSKPEWQLFKESRLVRLGAEPAEELPSSAHTVAPVAPSRRGKYASV